MEIELNDSEIEQDAMETEYGEEIMSAGWNPAVDQVFELLSSATGATLGAPASSRN